MKHYAIYRKLARGYPPIILVRRFTGEHSKSRAKGHLKVLKETFPAIKFQIRKEKW